MSQLPDDPNIRTVAEGVHPGDTLAGRYRLEREIGRGGMGVVWLAQDAVLDEPVAVKLLPSWAATNSRARTGLEREARTCRKLSHPSILRLHTLEIDESSQTPIAFLVMEYVEGETIDDVLGREPDGIDAERVIGWAEPIAAAIDYAHSQGVMHRDVKPSNIMIAKDGRVLLMDFGIARTVRDTSTSLTGRDSSGSLIYMSPQQLNGLNETSNDVYALAATLYEALRGAAPFTTGDIPHQIRYLPPPALEGVAPEVAAAMARGLAKESGERPANAAALVALMRTPVPPVRPVVPPKPPAPPAPPKPQEAPKPQPVPKPARPAPRPVAERPPEPAAPNVPAAPARQHPAPQAVNGGSPVLRTLEIIGKIIVGYLALFMLTTLLVLNALRDATWITTNDPVSPRFWFERIDWGWIFGEMLLVNAVIAAGVLFSVVGVVPSGRYLGTRVAKWLGVFACFAGVIAVHWLARGPDDVTEIEAGFLEGHDLTLEILSDLVGVFIGVLGGLLLWRPMRLLVSDMVMLGLLIASASALLIRALVQAVSCMGSAEIDFFELLAEIQVAPYWFQAWYELTFLSGGLAAGMVALAMGALLVQRRGGPGDRVPRRVSRMLGWFRRRPLSAVGMAAPLVGAAVIFSLVSGALAKIPADTLANAPVVSIPRNTTLSSASAPSIGAVRLVSVSGERSYDDLLRIELDIEPEFGSGPLPYTPRQSYFTVGPESRGETFVYTYDERAFRLRPGTLYSGPGGTNGRLTFHVRLGKAGWLYRDTADRVGVSYTDQIVWRLAIPAESLGGEATTPAGERSFVVVDITELVHESLIEDGLITAMDLGWDIFEDGK